MHYMRADAIAPPRLHATVGGAQCRPLRERDETHVVPSRRHCADGTKIGSCAASPAHCNPPGDEALVKEIEMLMSYHRAWRHAYAAGCWQRPRRSRRTTRHRTHSMFSWSSDPRSACAAVASSGVEAELSEAQVRDVVDVLDRLKTAYNQARLDQTGRRPRLPPRSPAQSSMPIRVTPHSRTGLGRPKCAERGSAGGNGRIFELLNEEQRREFAYLLRSGAFVL